MKSHFCIIQQNNNEKLQKKNPSIIFQLYQKISIRINIYYYRIKPIINNIHYFINLCNILIVFFTNKKKIDIVKAVW